MKRNGRRAFYMHNCNSCKPRRLCRKEFFQEKQAKAKLSMAGKQSAQENSKQWKKRGYHQKYLAKYLLSGGAGHTPILGLPETETEDRGRKTERKKEKKARKQLRYRRNKKRKHHQKSGKGAQIIIEKRRFYIAGKKHKLGQRRKKRRREYRAFINTLVSGMRKKEEYKWLRRLPDLERKVVLRNPIVKRKVQISTTKAMKKNFQHIRKEWKKWVQKDKI
jgi:hypothetical protein